MSSEVAGYFERLRAHLHLDQSVESDVMRELAAHVDDRIAELVRRGMSEQRARRVALDGFGRPQTLAHLLRQAQLTTTWGEAVLGGAAFALIAFVMGLEAWHMPAVAFAAGALVIAVTLYGLWLGRPAWFYPWAGTALSLPLVAGYIAFAVLHREAPNIAGGSHDALALAGVAGAALYFPVGLLVVAVSVLVAARRDWLDASVLLSPLPGVLAAIIAIHRAGGLTESGAQLSDASFLLSGVYLCMAVAALVLLRAPVRALKVMTLVGAALLLLSGSTLLADPSGGLVTLAGRAALLVAFLLSPALVARHA